ncbi:MAG: hypothetical protein H6734_28300 [Alphaproteobacteria bacterium]|nr:hypothetical protein [Alphaproteobacteria bacterium]MCB9684308.1 hypothetical protein [Alphaproteobacteria bacterium]
MSVVTSLEALPTSGLTVTVLQQLDRFVPGAWTNVTRFDDVVRDVLGEDASPGMIAAVRQKALALEAANASRWQHAVTVYSLVDTVDTVAAGAAVASKVGSMFGSLSFLEKFTPKPETTQAVDAGLKLVAELVAFGLVNGVPSMSVDGVARFTGALADYARYDLIRIAAWVVFDGVVPLGPDFVGKLVGTWKGLANDQLVSNAAFKQLSDKLPGNSADEKKAFVVHAIDQTGDWVGRFIQEKGITQQGVLKNLEGAMGVAAGGMDYVAAAVDASTAYFSHTGTQTVARALARQGLEQLKQDAWKEYLARHR